MTKRNVWIPDKYLGRYCTSVYEKGDYYPLPSKYCSEFGLICKFIHEDKYCTAMRDALNNILSYCTIKEVCLHHNICNTICIQIYKTGFIPDFNIVFPWSCDITDTDKSWDKTTDLYLVRFNARKYLRDVN